MSLSGGGAWRQHDTGTKKERHLPARRGEKRGFIVRRISHQFPQPVRISPPEDAENAGKQTLTRAVGREIVGSTGPHAAKKPQPSEPSDSEACRPTLQRLQRPSFNPPTVRTSACPGSQAAGPANTGHQEVRSIHIGGGCPTILEQQLDVPQFPAAAEQTQRRNLRRTPAPTSSRHSESATCQVPTQYSDRRQYANNAQKQ